MGHIHTRRSTRSINGALTVHGIDIDMISLTIIRALLPVVRLCVETHVGPG